MIGVVLVAVLAVLGGSAWALLTHPGRSASHPAARATRRSTPGAAGSTRPTAAPCDASAAIARWPLPARLAQLLMVGVTPVDAHQILAQDDVGGIFINTDTAGQLTPDGGTSLDSAARVPPFVSLDEEGGRVQRISLLVGAIPSARQMAATMTPTQVQALATQRAQALRRYGVTMDLAPVADVSSQPAAGEIGDRSFSSDPTVVTEYAQAFARGLQAGGVIPIFKHFPGLGHATGDSDTGPALAPALPALQASDLVPYRTLLALPGPLGVMVGHVTVPGLTTTASPASLNPAAINGLLRTDLRYDGFVITDDLGSAGAITMDHTVPDATVQAIEAGADMALVVSDDQVPAVLAALTAAVQSHALTPGRGEHPRRADPEPSRGSAPASPPRSRPGGPGCHDTGPAAHQTRGGMTLTAPAAPAALAPIGRRDYPVTFPSRRDPRLQLAAVILSLQVLGQTSFGFNVSIAQILVALVSAAVVEVGVTLWRRGEIVWPASALLTGSSVAFVLRVTGTQHGQWWSLNGAWIFAGTAAVSVLSKYVIRVGHRHVFNPSNIGLVLCFLVLGSSRVNPLDLWWARPGPALALALAIIVVGGLVIVTRLGMLRVAVSFWVTFAACLAVLAASGHAITTRWYVGPVDGRLFWTALVTSPEILVFLFFMITDPKTSPRGRVSQVLFGAAVAVAAALLAAPQQTEFATKVAILAGLAVVCVLRFPLERLLPPAGSDADRPRRWFLGSAPDRRPDPAPPPRGRAGPARRGAAWLGAAGLVAGLLVVAGIPARSGAAPAGGPAVLAGRPAITIRDAALPPVTVSADAHTLDAAISEPQARAIARDLLADLIITGRAEQRRDPKLAATAGTGAWLTQVNVKIQVARHTGRIEIDTYDLDRITIVLVRTRYWASPQLGTQTRGRIERVVDQLGARPTVLGRSSAPYHRTFVLVASGGHYLITADDVP